MDGGGGTEFFASQDESHEEDAGDQATAEEGDGRPTHSTHPHVTHTYTQDARKAAEGPVNPLTPIPHQPQIIPSSPIPHTRAAARAAPAVSAHVFNRKNTNPLRCAAGRHAHIDSGS